MPGNTEHKVHKMTVLDLIDFLKKQKPTKEIWLASDEEGNSFGPLVWIDSSTEGRRMRELNIGMDTGRITLYPVSGYEEEYNADQG